MEIKKKAMEKTEAKEKTKEALIMIQQKKVALQKEFENVNAELKALELNTQNPSGFEISEILNTGNTTQSLKEKAKKIKKALELPNYVDEDFRKYSLIYLKEILGEHLNEINSINTEIEKLKKEKYDIPYKINTLIKQRSNAIDEFYRKTEELGIQNEFTGIGLHGASTLLSMYEEKCKQYDG